MERERKLGLCELAGDINYYLCNEQVNNFKTNVTRLHHQIYRHWKMLDNGEILAETPLGVPSVSAVIACQAVHHFSLFNTERADFQVLLTYLWV